MALGAGRGAPSAPGVDVPTRRPASLSVQAGHTQNATRCRCATRPAQFLFVAFSAPTQVCALATTARRDRRSPNRVTTCRASAMYDSRADVDYEDSDNETERHGLISSQPKPRSSCSCWSALSVLLLVAGSFAVGTWCGAVLHNDLPQLPQSTPPTSSSSPPPPPPPLLVSPPPLNWAAAMNATATTPRPPPPPPPRLRLRARGVGPLALPGRARLVVLADGESVDDARNWLRWDGAEARATCTQFPPTATSTSAA